MASRRAADTAWTCCTQGRLMASAGRRETSLHNSQPRVMQPYKLYLELSIETADSVATDQKGLLGLPESAGLLPIHSASSVFHRNAFVFYIMLCLPGFQR